MCTILQSAFGISVPVKAESVMKSTVDTWDTTPVTNMPTTRKEYGMVEVDGLIYCIGGYNSSALSVVEVYNPKTNTWQTKTPMPTARGGLEAVTDGSKIYCLGGYSSYSSHYNVLEIYDVKTDTWTTGASMLSERSCFSAAILNGKIYCISGRYSDYYVTAFDMYDIKSNSWSTITSSGYTSAKDDSSLIAYNDRLYLIGGYESREPFRMSKNNQEEYSSIYIKDTISKNARLWQWDQVYRVYASVHEYDVSTNTWTTKTSMPSSKASFATVEIDGFIYCMGGFSDSDDGQSVQVYDIANDSWATKTSMPESRRDFSAFYFDGKIYCMGSNTSSSVLTYTVKSIAPTPEVKSVNFEISINPKNALSISLNTSQIVFEDFSYIESVEKKNALEITIESSLPYDIKTYLEGDIVGSTYGNKLDNSIINIKSSSESTYKGFSNTVTQLDLFANQPLTEKAIHSIDIKLVANKIKQVDSYKAVLKFEVQQL
jgi:N-acetylneuraminic acid mutarotase